MTVGVEGGAGSILDAPRAGAHLRVVVVIPCLDDARFLAACLDALTHQTRRPDDVVVVHQQDTAQDGEIVVALVGEEATVKRFFKESDHVRLQPENDALEPIRSREVKVLGRVVGVMRRVA